MKKALITGITGQDGSYLTEFLIGKGYEVHGIIRRASTFNTLRIDHLYEDQLAGKPRMILHYGDLTDSSSLNRILERVQPCEIYNLAAQSHVQVSFEVPEYTAEVDGIGTLRLLDAIRETGVPARFYQASTSELYGKVQEIPQTETTPFYPRSPYGVAKVYGHYITMNYRESFDMHASSGILFNHESPLRGKEFVTRKITLGLAALAHGGDQPVELGNMDAKRDWGFAGDYVEGMWRMLQQDVADDYVLATGVTTTIRDFFTYAGNAMGMDVQWDGEGEAETATDAKTGKLVMRVNPKFYRPAEVDLLIGDASKAEEKLGWKATVDIEGLSQMMAKSDYDALA